MSKGLVVAVVGATGLVGRELLETLRRRKFPARKILAFNSRRQPTLAALRGAELVFMVSSDSVSKRFSKPLARSGVWVIDDSSAFRLDPEVPLVIPEVNEDALRRDRRLIAGPNCTLTGAAVAGLPLIRAAGAAALRLASYQAVSGAGREAIEEFKSQWRAVSLSNGSDPADRLRRLQARALPQPIALNLFPQVGSFDGAGHSSEERKVALELRKIWRLPKLPVSATAVRVSVLRGHSLALWIEMKKALSPGAACRLLRRAEGVRLWGGNSYPTPLSAAGSWPVHVARVRQGAHAKELCLWVFSDNLLKGAALNSVQIAEALLRRGWL